MTDKLQTYLIHLQANDILSNAESAVIYLLRDKSMSYREIRELLGWSKFKHSRVITSLTEKNILLKHGTEHRLNHELVRWKTPKVAEIATGGSNSEFDRNINEQLYDQLIRFAQKKGLNQDDAEDIVQIALSKAKRFFKKNFRPDSYFFGWICKITHNTIRDYWRRRKDSQLFENEIGLIATDESIEKALEEKVQIAQFKQQINQLEPLQRNLLELVMNDVSYGEIAVLYDMPKGTVKSTIHRAKQQLYLIASQ